MHCTLTTEFYIITVTIKVPSFGDVNTFSQIIILEQTLIYGSPFLTRNNKYYILETLFPIPNDINLQKMFIRSFLKCF